MKDILYGILLGCSFGMIVSLFMWIIPLQDKVKVFQEKETYINITQLRKQGSTSTYGKGELGKDFINYDLRSWDGGRNWYAVDYNSSTDELKVLGAADSIYPDLLRHLDAWDKLTKEAEKTGGVNPNTEEGLKLLEEAGFTVKKKEDEKP